MITRTSGARSRPAALLAVLLAGVLALVGCHSGTTAGQSPFTGPENDPTPLRIVAATELADLAPVLEQASDEIGFDIIVDAPAGTLANSQALKNGEFDGHYDATWFATNRYLDLIGGSGALKDQQSIATSPVAFGIDASTAAELGWASNQPTWAEIADAAERGDFSFGMTDPASSNSGFTALVSVATALADTGQALSEADIHRVAPQLAGIFGGQTVTSGSSGWLADTFLADPERADAIINYESVLHSMTTEGANLDVIVPADGVISADYPLSTMSRPAQEDAGEKVVALSSWLIERPALMSETFRRPVDASAQLLPELSDQLIIELPFPGSASVTDMLIDAYNNQLRAPGRAAYVLDTSGSMEGERMDSLHLIMSQLIDGSAQTSTGPVGLRDREEVMLVPFASGIGQVTQETVSLVDPAPLDRLQDNVDLLRAEGSTALYAAVYHAYLELNRDPAAISSIVLMTDGESNEGMNFEQFAEAYRALPDEAHAIPVFVILYGEANVNQMNQLAEMTGGRVFDALDGNLADAFKEIRAYQ